MDRAKKYVHELGEYVLQMMEKKPPTTPDNVTYMAAMCEDFNEICEFVENICDHHDGSLYEMDGMKPERGITGAHDGTGAGWDNPGRRRR